MVICVLLQIFFRFVLSISIPMTEELARILFSMVIMFAVVQAESEDLQLKTTYFFLKLPYKLKYIVYLLTCIASVVFLICLIYGCARMFVASAPMKYGTMPWLSPAITYIPPIVSFPFAVYYIMKRVVYFKETDERLSSEFAESTEEENAL